MQRWFVLRLAVRIEQTLKIKRQNVISSRYVSMIQMWITHGVYIVVCIFECIQRNWSVANVCKSSVVVYVPTAVCDMEMTGWWRSSGSLVSSGSGWDQGALVDTRSSLHEWFRFRWMCLWIEPLMRANCI